MKNQLDFMKTHQSQSVDNHLFIPSIIF